uniref:Uncharacterized protein n=1 Tax=Fagus sylvatica TaxID=28930 RepID=A0A2N9G7B7_FAGSY
MKPARYEELIIDVPQVMEPAQWPECCIYRVPKRLRQINNEAYTPKLISIGPFHHGKDELKEMEMLKVRYFKDFCYRTGKCQKDLASVIEDNEVKIRHCYAENFDISSEDFVKMVLLDSAFIIEFFLKLMLDVEEREYKNDYISSKPWLSSNIAEDLILLENQLPLFILEELHNQFSSNEAVANIVNKLALEITETDSCYNDLAEKLNRHYDQCCNRNMGYLRSTYFHNLWRGTATAVGLILLGFTIWDIIKTYK